MKKSKLITILRCFTPKELKQFELFVRSPYFNSREELAGFYHALLEFAPDFDDDQLEKGKFWSLAFHDQKYDEKELGYMMSWLVQLTESFIMHQKVEQDPLRSKLDALNMYYQWNLEKNFGTTSKQIGGLLSDSGIKDADHFLHSYVYHTLLNASFERKKKYSHNESLQAAADNLDNFYIGTKLKYCCAIINSKTWLSTPYEVKLLNELLVYLKENPHDDIPYIGIYYNILLTLLEPDEEAHFGSLIELLGNNAGMFEPEEAREMYTYAINYCIHKINTGAGKYYQELFDIYQSILPTGVLLVNDHLSPWTVNTIVSVACHVNKGEWAMDFIQDYKDKIRVGFRKNAVNYNMAYLHFNNGNYEEALSHLNRVEFNDPSYSMNSKSMLLKLYYELNEVEALYSLVDSFRVFIRRNKLISDGMKSAYLSLIKFTKQLIKIQGKEAEKLHALEEQIKTTKQLAGRSWIISKVEAKMN